MTRRWTGRTALWVALLALGLLALLALYVLVGSGGAGNGPLLNPELLERHQAILRGLRLRRGLLAILVGAALSVSGAGFQALLRNPLADPFVTGVSGGAAVGGTLVMVLTAFLTQTLGASLTGPAGVFAGAFVGAVVVALLLSRLATAGGLLNTNSLLLMGVVFNFFASAVVLFLKAIIQGTKLSEILFWLMGTLAVEGLPDALLWLAGTLVLLSTGGLILLARRINLVSLGEETAWGAGVNPESVKRWLFLLSSVLVALGVSLAGFVGFVGLVIPHVVRILAGSDHRGVFPLSALGGATFLLLADLVARLSFPLAGTQLPVGVVTAFVGGPLFIVLLARAQAKGGGA